MGLAAVLVTGTVLAVMNPSTVALMGTAAMKLGSGSKKRKPTTKRASGGQIIKKKRR
jgi:hypothetical protein